MGKRIRRLSEQTVNQIAAGEVIEDPSSVVKELFENAVDAGATNIEVVVLGGGFQLIQVSDDGSGMEEEDAVLCLQRHATSKIASIEDLTSVRSMGFRGEALASIAAISEVNIKTATGGIGTCIQAVGGNSSHVRSCARRQGTTVEVRRLFFNVPVRKAFQKTASSSMRAISSLIQRLALAYPNIGIKYGPLSAAPESFRSRVACIFGESFIQAGRFHSQEKEMKLNGFLANPREARRNRSGQYLFINQRVVHSEWFSDTVREIMGTMLEAHLHPVYVFDFSLPLEWVDVNVHPRKLDVRFKEKEKITTFLREYIRECFAHTLALKPITAPVEKFSLRLHEEETSSPLVLRDESIDLPMLTSPTIIGIYEKYLLVDSRSMSGVDEGILMVDLVAAQRRIYEKSEVKNSGFTEREGVEILMQLLRVEQSSICPKGEPIMGLIDEKTTEKIFKAAARKVAGSAQDKEL